MNICKDCGKGIKQYSTRCRSCAAIARWDKRGRNPKSYCIGCGKEVSHGKNRCQSCSIIYRYDKKGRKPKNYCMDCEKGISPKAIRCNSCAGKARRKHKNYCVDCEVEIWRGSTRCQKCSSKDPERNQKIREAVTNPSEETRLKIRKARKRQLPPNKNRKFSKEARHNMSVGQLKYYETHEPWNKGKTNLWHHTKDTKQVLRAASKAAWTRGDFDDVFHSPTKPELNLMAVLDELKIEYIPQYRIETYPYDVYLLDYKILIEYDGWWWHHSDWAIEHGFTERDSLKNKLAKGLGLRLIRIKGTPGYDLSYNEIFLKVKEQLCLI